VVHNGVPVLGPLEERARPRGTWTLSIAALFRQRKGLEVLLEALARLRAEGHDVRLRAIGGFGNPEYEAGMHALADSLQLQGAVDWIGFSRDVIGEMRKSDLFVLPSLFGEGLPMVVLEAMSAGVPVVATRVEGTPEAVRDGIDGLLANPGDAKDLGRAIATFIRGDSDWAAMRTSAHKRQADHFSDTSMTAGVAAVYRQVLEHACSSGN
jgi:glycosyltransferase involved in cell wall biosynthesis